MIKSFFSLIFLLYSISVMAILDTGNGSDGACTWTGAIVNQTYNCTTLTVTGVATIAAGAAVTVKVQGAVTINNNIVFSGSNGAAGGAGASAGGTPGPGGFAGAGCPVPGIAADCTAQGSGPATSAGNSGTDANDTSFASNVGGGGGSGGRHANTLPTAGSNGTSNGGGIVGTGGALPASDYGDETQFDSSFQGGTGGGAGGQGDSAQVTFRSGGAGGGGGGALRIYAGGNITIAGGVSLDARGGDGGNGASAGAPSAGGGGGAGGAIYLASEANITNDGTLDVRGGSAGGGGTVAGANGGNGGSGGSGRIYLVDLDGVISGANATLPAGIAVIGALPTPQQVYESDISFACGSISGPPNQTGMGLLSFFFGLLLLIIVKKFKTNLL